LKNALITKESYASADFLIKPFPIQALTAVTFQNATFPMRSFTEVTLKLQCKPCNIDGAAARLPLKIA